MEYSPQNLQNTPPLAAAISTRLYVPGWWVRAWEHALMRQNASELGTQPPGLDATLLPSLDIPQLNFVAVLCAELQQQMLAETWKPGDALCLHWAEAKKLVSSTDPGTIAKLAVALEQLGGLRLAAKNPVDASIKTIPLFPSERWNAKPDDSNDALLTLSANDQTLELLIGYVDGHIDLLRKIQGRPATADILAESAPLVLWKPVWLELALAEQAVYLRLEKSMQWDMSWLQLDGVFGATIDELFEHIRLAKRASATSSVLMERLRVFGRLGRKLVSHGVIAREPQSNFFAVSAQATSSKGPSIIWQASSERLLSAEENAYFGRAAQSMFTHIISPAIPSLLQILSVGTEFADRSKQATLYVLIQQLKKVPSGALRIGPNTLIQIQILFLEWALRKLPGAIFPLPAELCTNDLVGLCRLDQQPVEQFRRFCERILATHEGSRILTEMPNACMASASKAELDRLLPRLQAALRTSAPPTSASENVKSGVVSAQNNALLPTVHTPTPVKPVVAQDAGQSALLRIAREELEKMMKADLRSFSALKESYLKSLEEPQRQLMSDVERRMKPQLFDQQLKQRLVRFMVEHPAAWKSTSQILQ